MKFLIDECLTLELVQEAHQLGFEAYHIAHIGRTSAADWDIAAFANADGFILVTNNAADFLRLYSRREMHSGLIIIIPSVIVTAQRKLFGSVLSALRDVPDLVNKVIEADFADGQTTLRLYEFPE